MSEYVFGRNPVLECLTHGLEPPGRILLAEDASGDVVERILRRAEERSVPVKRRPAGALTELAGTDRHQGAVAELDRLPLRDLEDLLGDLPDKPTRRLLVLDRVQDPVNLGKLIRSARYFGYDGLIKTRDRTAPFSSTVIKTSAGAAFGLPLVEVTNLRRCLERLKEARFWLVGADVEGEHLPEDLPRERHLALVLGNEQSGLRRLTRETCDYLVRIPGAGTFDSLNVAVAGAILAYVTRPPRTDTSTSGPE